MKRIFCFVCATVVSICLLGCLAETVTTTTTSVQTNTDKTEVYFRNLSDYKVNVYFNTTPYSKDKRVIATVAKRSDTSIEFRPSMSDVSDVFYFEYMIPVGDMLFPAYQNEQNIGYKAVIIEANKTNAINIEKITECNTDSAFFLIENKSGVSIQLKKGMFFRSPVGTDDTNIVKNKSAVYELNNSVYSDFTFSGLDIVKLVVNATDLALPISSVEKGMIYTITVTDDNAVLKSVTPFNIDIQNQIWEKEIDAADNVQCVRQNFAKDGIIVISTVSSRPNVIQCDMIDRYGKPSDKLNCEIQNAKSVTVYDALQVSDGTVVMLMTVEFADETRESHLLGYNFAGKTVMFDYKFDTDCVWVFRQNMQNSIVSVADGVYAVAGGRVDDELSMSSFIMKIDATDRDIITVTKSFSDETSDYGSEVQMMFTSVYYDGTQFFVCGYENCDFRYESRIHRGVIYRISDDLQTWERVYAKDRSLLFGIMGQDGKYWVCGEYADTGNILKACLVASDNIDTSSDMQVFSSALSYHWFNQIALSGDKLLLCGPTSEHKDGSGKSYSVVRAVTKSGTPIWCNIYEDYLDAPGCIPNGIGSYTVQLHSENKTVIKSADLLGR